MSIKAVIFDRDGVLIDTEDINLYSVNETLKKMNLKIPQEEILAKVVARNKADYLPEFKDKYNLTEEQIEQFKTIQGEIYFKEFKEKVALAEGAEKILKHLKEKGIITVMATSSGSSNIFFFEKFDIKKYFNAIIMKSDVTKRKPDPEIYNKAKAKTGAKDDEIIVIEDSNVGVAAAKAAGLKCIGIKNKYAKHEGKADYIVNDLIEAGKIIDRLIQNK